MAVLLTASTSILYPMTVRAGSPALPTGGSVVVGSATIVQSGANTLNVTTGSARTAINWQSFSIGAGGTVDIQQPGVSSMTYNEVKGSDPSVIFGTLHSNGQVVLANPNGIWFGQGSHIDTSSIVASTATASQQALAAFAAGGRLALDVPGLATSSVVNDGEITVADQGLAALVAPGVANRGTITANWGQVHLAGGTYATLDFYGDGLISFAVSGTVSGGVQDTSGKALGAIVSNSGSIAAAGGQVLLTAATAKAVVDDAINMSGVVQASAATQDGGDIVLDGGQSGTVAVSGTLDASAPQAKGGTISVTGSTVNLVQTARLDVSGVTGGSVNLTNLNPDSSGYTGGFIGYNTSGGDATVDVGTGNLVSLSRGTITGSYSDGAVFTSGPFIGVASNSNTNTGLTVVASGVIQGTVLTVTASSVSLTGSATSVAPIIPTPAKLSTFVVPANVANPDIARAFTSNFSDLGSSIPGGDLANNTTGLLNATLGLTALNPLIAQNSGKTGGTKLYDDANQIIDATLNGNRAF